MIEGALSLAQMMSGRLPRPLFSPPPASIQIASTSHPWACEVNNVSYQEHVARFSVEALHDCGLLGAISI
jgi:hypothetical protein